MASPYKLVRLASHKWHFSLFLLVSQIIYIIMFAMLVRYGPDSGAPSPKPVQGPARKMNSANENLNNMYPMFQDMQVMLFVGFGFLMMFLKNYAFSAFGYNFLLCAFCIQHAILIGGVAQIIVAGIDGDYTDNRIYIDMASAFNAEFACAAVMISFGAVLGKLTGFQLLIMAKMEILLYIFNQVVSSHYIKASDMGGSMFVHVFGAYFGLTVARVINRDNQRNRQAEFSNYHSDIFSLVGTVFLWVYWPSFNSVAASDEERVRSVLNTYLALCASCVTTFALSSITSKTGKITIAHIQNATLAGGVAIGTCCNMMVYPPGALAIGMTAGAVSTLGFRYLQGFLDQKFKLHDTCGVNNLHGLPGLLAGICGVIVAFFATNETYGNADRVFEDFSSGPNQGLRQFLGLSLTICVAILGGLLTGVMVRFLPSLNKNQYFNDTDFWEDVVFDDLDESKEEYIEINEK